jgi:hypothetical protein
MRDELQQKIYDKYPEMFNNRYHTEILCGDCWLPIVDAACQKIKRRLKGTGHFVRFISISSLSYPPSLGFLGPARLRFTWTLVRREFYTHNEPSNQGKILIGEVKEILCMATRLSLLIPEEIINDR